VVYKELFRVCNFYLLNIAVILYVRTDHAAVWTAHIRENARFSVIVDYSPSHIFEYSVYLCGCLKFVQI